VVKAVSSKDEAEGDDGDHDLAYGTDDEGASSLLKEALLVGSPLMDSPEDLGFHSPPAPRRL